MGLRCGYSNSYFRQWLPLQRASSFLTGRVVAERDFINSDAIVSDEVGQPYTGDEDRSSQNIHYVKHLLWLVTISDRLSVLHPMRNIF